MAFGHDISFYDALKKDPAHRLIVKAIDADKEGTTKQLLNSDVPVTALVPTDAVSAGTCDQIAAIGRSAYVIFSQVLQQCCCKNSRAAAHLHLVLTGGQVASLSSTVQLTKPCSSKQDPQ